MADYRNDEDRTLPTGVRGMNLTPETDPEHLIPEHTHAAAPGTIGAVAGTDPDAVRGEIERLAGQLLPPLHDWLERNRLEVLIVENAWAIPMHPPSWGASGCQPIAARSTPATTARAST